MGPQSGPRSPPSSVPGDAARPGLAASARSLLPELLAPEIPVADPLPPRSGLSPKAAPRGLPASSPRSRGRLPDSVPFLPLVPHGAAAGSIQMTRSSFRALGRALWASCHLPRPGSLAERAVFRCLSGRRGHRCPGRTGSSLGVTRPQGLEPGRPVPHRAPDAELVSEAAAPRTGLRTKVPVTVAAGSGSGFGERHRHERPQPGLPGKDQPPGLPRSRPSPAPGGSNCGRK